MIASVLFLINEVELSIYRFSGSGVKNNKRYPRPVKLGINWITSRWAFNALIGCHCLDRTSIEPRPEVDREGVNLNREEEATG